MSPAGGLGVAPLRCIAGGALLACLSLAQARDIPRVLTLEEALIRADDGHPSLQVSQAELSGSEAEWLTARSRNDLLVGLQLNPRWIDPNDYAPIEGNDDSRAILYARKDLYDFGRTARALEAAEAQVRSRELQHLDARARLRLKVIERYFDVLVADLTYARDNEAMASAYVSMERAQERNALGQVSDIELLEMRDRYQETRLARLRSLHRARASRTVLAEALNRPEQPPSDLVPPRLPGIAREPPEYEQLVEIALAENTQLRAWREQVRAARQRVDARRAERRPTLSAELQAGWWAREFGGDRNPLSAGVVLDIPLYQGERVSAGVDREQAALLLSQARTREYEHELRQAVLETWLAIQTLRTQREQAQVHADYRDLYLDRSRALYEMEVQTDLGDAMVAQSASMLLTAKTELELALAWERLALLTGRTKLSALELPSGDDNPASRSD
jgi:outer membrane protein TolC